MVALAWSLDDATGEFLAQLVEVDGLGDAALLVPCLGDAVGKELGQLVDVLGGQVGSVQFELFHLAFLCAAFLCVVGAWCADFWVPYYFTL